MKAYKNRKYAPEDKIRQRKPYTDGDMRKFGCYLQGSERCAEWSQDRATWRTMVATHNSHPKTSIPKKVESIYRIFGKRKWKQTYNFMEEFEKMEWRYDAHAPIEPSHDEHLNGRDRFLF